MAASGFAAMLGLLRRKGVRVSVARARFPGRVHVAQTAGGR